MSKPKQQSQKPAKSKRGLVSSSVKPSRIALFLLGALMIVSGIYYVLSSHAAGSGNIYISTLVDGQPASGFRVTLKDVGSSGGCDSNIAPGEYWYTSNGSVNEWYGNTNPIPAGGNGLHVFGCYTGGINKTYAVSNAKAYTPQNVNYVNVQQYNAQSGGWTTLGGGNAFNVPDTGQTFIRINYSSIAAPPPPPPPSNAVITSFSASPPEISSTQSVTLSWAVTGQSSCDITDSAGSPTVVVTNGSSYSLQLGSSRSFQVYCHGSNGGTDDHKNLNVSFKSAPVGPNPPQPQGGNPQPQGGNPQPQGGSPQPQGGTTQHTTTTNSKPSVTATASNPSDTEAPSTPGNLKSSQNDSASVDLTWDASTDNSGVTGYVVERSTDGANWTKLSDTVTDTSYNDTTIAFGTKYSYRVSAFDGSGNVSVPATVDVETETFTANAFADKDNKISSDDGQVTVLIPSGALGEDAACTVSGREDITASLPKGSSYEAGPYQLVCKNKDGNTIDSFNKAVTIEVSLSNPKGNLTHKIYDFENEKWVATKIKYNSKQPNFSWTTDKPNSFAVVKSSGINWSLWISIIFIILLLGAIVFWFLRRRANSSGGTDAGYDSYVQSHYIDQPAAPGTDTTPHHEVGERAGIADFQPVTPPPIPGQVVSADELRAPGDTGGAAPNPTNSPDVNKIVNHPQDPKPPTA
jgi:hypothetical protein